LLQILELRPHDHIPYRPQGGCGLQEGIREACIGQKHGTVAIPDELLSIPELEVKVRRRRIGNKAGGVSIIESLPVLKRLIGPLAGNDILRPGKLLQVTWKLALILVEVGIEVKFVKHRSL